jgi:hypothetical protein
MAVQKWMGERVWELWGISGREGSKGGRELLVRHGVKGEFL